MKTLRTALLGAATAAAMGLVGASAQAEIIIATAGPMTGPFAVFGEQMKRGAMQAAADLNAKGGVQGQNIRVVVGDDACDPKKAVTVAKSMVNKGVRLMAGHFCSGSSIAASDIYNEEGILLISPASTNPKLTERGLSNVYRVCGRDDQQGHIAGNYLADNFGGRRIAIVHDSQVYSKGLTDMAKAQLNRRGMNESLLTSITAGKKDYSDFIGKLKRNRIDVIYYGGYHPEAAVIVRQMRKQGMSTAMISGDDLATNKYWAITGAAGEGTLMTFPPDARKSTPAGAVVAAMRKGGYEPEGYALHTYAAIQVWAQAVAKAGSFDLAKVKKALNSVSFKTVLGEISFDGKGDIQQPAYVWYEWSKGKFAER